jgi:hypothetical protein
MYAYVSCKCSLLTFTRHKIHSYKTHKRADNNDISSQSPSPSIMMQINKITDLSAFKSRENVYLKERPLCVSKTYSGHFNQAGSRLLSCMRSSNGTIMFILSVSSWNVGLTCTDHYFRQQRMHWLIKGIKHISLERNHVFRMSTNVTTCLFVTLELEGTPNPLIATRCSWSSKRYTSLWNESTKF